MKKMFIIPLVPALIQTSALAGENVPEPGPDRLFWAVKTCGAMPKGMIAGLLAIAIMITITAIVYKKNNKEDNVE